MNKAKHHYQIKNGKKSLIIPGPRLTNEISVTEDSKGSMPCNEKDSMKFSLVKFDACIIALKTLYGNIRKETKAEIKMILAK